MELDLKWFNETDSDSTNENKPLLSTVKLGKMAQTDPILTVEQVAEMLQIHPFTVLNYIKAGKLKAAQLGRVYRIRQSAVDNFLEEATFAPSPKSKKKTTESRRSHRPSVKRITL